MSEEEIGGYGLSLGLQAEWKKRKDCVVWFRREFPELVFFLLNLIASHEKNDLLSLEEEKFREMFK